MHQKFIHKMWFCWISQFSFRARITQLYCKWEDWVMYFLYTTAIFKCSTAPRRILPLLFIFFLNIGPKSMFSSRSHSPKTRARKKVLKGSGVSYCSSRACTIKFWFPLSCTSWQSLMYSTALLALLLHTVLRYLLLLGTMLPHRTRVITKSATKVGNRAIQAVINQASKPTK